MAKILVIEDEVPISELIELTLTTVGYEVSVAYDGTAGLSLVEQSTPDMIILDLMLPDANGYDLIPRFAKLGIPIILLSARDTLLDKVKCLELGADDYMTKPFVGMELLARIKAVLRRAGKNTCHYVFDDIEVQLKERRVSRSGEFVDLTPKEFDLLRVLLENKGIAMSRDKLLELVWDYDYVGDTRTVDMHIQRLRHKLTTSRIATVYKLGYRLEV